MEFEIEDVALPEEKPITFEEFYNSMKSQKYRRHYEKLINRAKERIIERYSEKHHIIPRCLKGTDDWDNLVYLTAREHYVAHQILVVLFPKIYKLAYAAQLMTIDALGNRVDNRYYGWLHEKVSEAAKNRVYSEEVRRNMSKGQLNRVLTVEQKERMMIGLKIGWATPRSEETRNKMSIKMKNRKISDRQKAILLAANLGVKRTEEFCKKLANDF